MYGENRKPLYGTIAYFGGWSVTFEAEVRKSSCTHSTLSGYGEFPRQDFPGLPVIDFRTLDGPGLPDRKFPDLPYVDEAYGWKGEFSRYVPLRDYLALCESNGIIVFRA